MSSPESTPVRDVDTAEALAMAGDGAVILDVREDDEWRSGHIEGAVHVPLGDLDPATLATDVPIVAVCGSGKRSSKAATQLTEAGHDVCNMTGGMKAWHQAALPVVTDDGRPGSL